MENLKQSNYRDLESIILECEIKEEHKPLPTQLLLDTTKNVSEKFKLVPSIGYIYLQ